MQFVKGGPDIPERLLQAHEDGHVVFFCGAGISYPACLPGFADLVKRLYSDLGISPSAVQRATLVAKQFDTAVGLLESDIVGGRRTVRQALANILQPNLAARNATTTHEALLTLGKNREGRTRLITTNFDRLFEEVIGRERLAVRRFQAPLLPVPKTRWDGLVYLHGLLGANPDPRDLDSLVLSSGDFGLAYLNEGWAARFSTELFRNYTVCFVGYSINDPVLRYMMDALAADRLLGESPPEMFAFGSHSKGKDADRASEWEAKNVTPILYREHWRHAYLHRTLRAWAETYRDGVGGKERIVVEYAIARPQESTSQDDFVSRMLWALSDPSGLPAKRFAELNPVPALDWLGPLTEDRFGHADLDRFGVAANQATDNELAFSLTHRPSPYDLAPWMALADYGAQDSSWDRVMHHLARWLIRHLDDPDLLLRLAKLGGHLNKDLAWLIQHRINELTRLHRSDKTEDLARLRSHSPNAVPRPAMRKLWGLFLSGRVDSSFGNLDLYGWREQLNQDSLTTTLRLQLRNRLTPRVALRKSFRFLLPDHEKSSDPERIRDLVDCEIVLSTSYVHSALREMRRDEGWITALPELLDDFTHLLFDALALMGDLNGATDRSDLSYVHQPSIAPHPQNRGLHNWTALIELTRDAWLAMADRSPEQASLVAETWCQMAYPLFRRLAYFAAAHREIIAPRRALTWLLADEHWWLWSVEVQREAMRLLVALSQRLDSPGLLALEEAVLGGPPRDMFKEDLGPEEWIQLRDRGIWLRLAKMDQTGGALTEAGKQRLTDLSVRYPRWRLQEGDRDEFPVWMGGGEDWGEHVLTPRRRPELVEWLKEHPIADHWQEDDWRQRCRESFATTACALYALTTEGVWPIDRWRVALQVWAEEELLRRSWRRMATTISHMPDEPLKALTAPIAWWLQAIADTFEGQEESFVTLSERLLALDYEGDETADGTPNRAINQAVGQVTDALLRWWFRGSLEDNQGLPEDLKSIFAQLCDTRADKLRPGRAMLATRVIVLFRVDRDWTTQLLLPLFDWGDSELEARSMWQGFLWSPRLYRPLMEQLKRTFLDTAHHYTKLGEYGELYVSLLTFAALDPADVFAKDELATATEALPQRGLDQAAEALARSLEGAGDQRADYWTNRIAPYLRRIWPKRADTASASIAESFGRLCIAAGEALPQALTQLGSWLQPVANADQLLHLLKQTNLCERFPAEALELLHATIGDTLQLVSADFETCLDAICRAQPTLEEDPRYVRLLTLRREGGRAAN